MVDKLLNIGPLTKLDVSAKQVVTLFSRSDSQEICLNLNIGPGAGVHLLAPVEAMASSYYIEIAEEAQFTMSILGLIDSNKTWDIKIKLQGQQAKANLQLAILGTVSSETKFNVLLDHQAEHTLGRINSRRIQMDNSTSEFVGTLYVDFKAQGTDTYLSDKSLLLGELSKAKSDPRLEILADEVRASHGATIGRLNPEELFYLRSRGLPERQAEVILMQSFLQTALVGVPLNIKDKFLHDISTR